MKTKIKNGVFTTQLSKGMTYSYCTLSKTEEVYQYGKRIHFYKYPIDHIMPLSDYISTCELWKERSESVLSTADFFKNFKVILNLY